jgi:hypothetical protein
MMVFEITVSTASCMSSVTGIDSSVLSSTEIIAVVKEVSGTEMDVSEMKDVPRPQDEQIEEVRKTIEKPKDEEIEASFVGRVTSC